MAFSLRCSVVKDGSISVGFMESSAEVAVDWVNFVEVGEEGVVEGGESDGADEEEEEESAILMGKMREGWLESREDE